MKMTKMKIFQHLGITILVSFFLLLVLIPVANTGHAASVPDFSLKRLDGSTFNLSEYIGKKVIVIDFWATWCKPCKKLMKHMNQVHLDYKDKIEVLAISTDDVSAISQVESYIKGKGFSFTVLLDPDGSVVRIFNPSRQIPFTVIIDKKGDIAYSHTGYMPGYEKEIIKKIEQLTHE